MSKTLRLLVSDWKAGNRTEFYLGTQLLSWLAPKNEGQKQIEVDIEPPDAYPLVEENNVIAQSAVIEEVVKVKEILAEERPDKVVTLGGTCIASQAPFDYLKGKYGDELGVIWIDAHPDISSPEVMNEEHAMVLGNLIGAGDPEFAEKVDHKFDSSSVLYVGLQEIHEEEKQLLDNLNFEYKVQSDEILNGEDIQQWIAEKGFEKIAIHFDIDVLSPSIFRDTYMAEPGLKEFPAAAGRMDFKQLGSIFNSIFSNSEVVGLTVAEYMPFDAINLKELLSKLDIFQE